MGTSLPPLERWDNFYVIVGSSAAGLTGLSFVVIALLSDAKLVRMSGLRAFITPIVLHFGAALWISALLCIPGHTAVSLAACVTVSGVVLSAYGAATTYRMYSNRKMYRPVFEDWVWNGTLPLLCYLALVAAGVLALRQAGPALYVIGCVALTLLFIGIHNAWGLAVWITVERPGAQQQAETPGSGAPDTTTGAGATQAPEPRKPAS